MLLRPGRLWDNLFAFCEGGWDALRSCTSGLSRRCGPLPRPRRVLALELLESRELLSAVQFSATSFEVNESQGTATVTVALDQASASPVSVNYTTMDGSATAGSDYAATSGTLTFAAGETSKTFTVTILNDSVAEGDETVGLMLSSPSGAVLGTPSAAPLTIHDDDNQSGVFRFSSASLSAGEGAGTATLTVERTETTGSASVTVSQIGGSATPGSDYTFASPLVVTFAAGQSQATVSVQVLEDSLVEGDETVQFALSSPSTGYTLDPVLSSTTLTIVDNDAAPANNPPTANPDSYGITHDNTLSTSTSQQPLGLLANDTDPDGNPLTVTAVNGSAAAVGSEITLASGARLTVRADGSFDYAPAAGFVGQETFGYTVSDGQASAFASVTINVTNEAPIASGTSLVVRESHTVSVDLSTLVDDPDWDGLTFTIVQGPSHGTLTQNPDTGLYDYTADPGYDGPDSFTYTANDGVVDSNTATVSIAVYGTNTAPVASSDSLAVTHDQAVTIDLVGLGTDADNDSLASEVVTQPSNGVVVVDEGITRYIPNAGFVGSDSFTFKVNDGTSDSHVATITVNVTNSAPTATGFGPLKVAQNGSILLRPTHFAFDASDADGDVLTVAVIDQPDHGALVLNADGTLTYTPDANYAGSDSFAYVLSDGVANSNVATVSLDVVSDAVVANDLSFKAAAEQPYELSPSDLLTHVSAGTSFGPVLVQVAGTSMPSVGTSSVTLASGSVLTLRDDGTVQYLPGAGVVGEETFTFSVSVGVVVANATVHMLVAQVQPQVPRLGAPVSRNTLAQELAARFNEWTDITGAVADDDAISLERINSLIASRTLSVEDAAAIAVLKAFVVQSPENLLRTGDYGDIFGVVIQQRLTRRGLADFTTAYNAVANVNGQRARELESKYRSMVNRLALDVTANRLFPANNAGAWQTVQQGQVGDCAFMSSLIGLARTNFAALRGRIRLVAPAAAGGPQRYEVTLFNDGRAVTIAVEEPTYAERALYGNTTDGARWVAIMEKAYVTNWPRDAVARYAGTLYDVAADGERVDRAIARVTGRAAAPRDPQAFFFPVILRAVLSQANAGRVVVVGSRAKEAMPRDFRTTFPERHAFSVVGFNNNRVTLRNPWNIDGPYGRQFDLSFAEFRRLFGTVSREDRP